MSPAIGLSTAAFSAVLACSLHPAAAKAMFTIFDPPGSVATEATTINTSGTIAGYYWDKNDVTHGFIRAANGTVTTFDPPGATSTLVSAINATGTSVGNYTDSDGRHCFMRSPSGAFTSFDLPIGGQGCYALSISAQGEISGYEYESRHDAYGFIRTQAGKIRTIKHTDSFTDPAAINDAGTTTGSTANDGAAQGFARDKQGDVTLFKAPGDINGTGATGINSAGAITGYYVDRSGADHSYVRAPTGAITEFDPPGATTSQSVGINTKGQITGFYYASGAYSGFVRSSAGKITSFVAPGAIATYPFAINSSGTVTGYYIDSNNNLHGFMWMP